MGLGGYRSFKQVYIDEGELVGDENVVKGEVSPDFRGRNSIQTWNMVKTGANSETSDGKAIFNVRPPKVNSLLDRSAHEITVFNTSKSENIEVRFGRSYVLVDEDILFDPATTKMMEYEAVIIGPLGRAYFYAAAIVKDGAMKLHLRTGSQDDRNL